MFQIILCSPSLPTLLVLGVHNLLFVVCADSLMVDYFPVILVTFDYGLIFSRLILPLPSMGLPGILVYRNVPMEGFRVSFHHGSRDFQCTSFCVKIFLV